MYLHSAELACEQAFRDSPAAGREKNYPRIFPAPRQSAPESLINNNNNTLFHLIIYKK